MNEEVAGFLPLPTYTEPEKNFIAPVLERAGGPEAAPQTMRSVFNLILASSQED